MGDDWKSYQFDWLEMSKKISNDGFLNLILNWGIGIDLKNSTRRILIVSIQMCPIFCDSAVNSFRISQIDRVELGIPRELLLRGKESKQVRAYYEFMIDAAVIFGANKTFSQSEMLDTLQFEMDLAKVSSYSIQSSKNELNQ